MITETILNGFFGVADFLLGLTPEIEWTIDTTAWQYAGDVLSMVCYLLPMGYILPAIYLIIALGIVRISFAAVRGFIDALPFI